MRGNTFAIIALVFFVLLSGLLGWQAYAQYNAVDRRPEAGGDLGLRYQFKDAVGERKKQGGLLAGHKKDLATEKKKYQAQYERNLLADLAVQMATINQDAALRYKNTATASRDKVPSENSKAKDRAEKAGEGYDTRKDEAQKTNDQRIKEITEKIGKLTKELETFKKNAADEFDRLTRGKSRLRNMLDHYEGEIAKLVTREDPPGLPPVGKVLTSDPDHNLAVINLGNRHGVKPGMRFEVFQTRHGNYRAHKGYIEVKTVTPEVSSCAILVKEVRLPRCNICSYTASQPEEQYCPRCTAPGTGQGAHRLRESKIVTMGKSDVDPIVKGDTVYNPFFGLKPRRYAICGENLIRGRKDFSPEAIKKAIELHGGVFDEQLSAKTNVLIALKGDIDVVKRAEELGIVVVRGFELFRYLDQR